ncbi:MULTISPECIES: hypothetical protein [Actinomycetes]|uniref:HK97 gp10 family phage protein n=1 Tax=Luedemannella helvata TaxID=349315 RepID=A0ABN2LB85_9ACTN|nr:MULTISPECIES: hypothetical protein [Streptomyces]KOV07520.1 hypothetical protein ADK92_05755 [Streptomyces sp. XY533]
MLEKFELDTAGVREVLKGQAVRDLVDGYAQTVADNVKAKVPSGVPIEVRKYTTDRGAATVVVADVRGMAWQARDGILTQSASAAGLEVKAAGAEE